MNKLFRILTVSFIIMSVFMISVSFASSSTSKAVTQISNAGTRIIGTVLWVGYAVAIGMVIYIGIRYILGAPDQKANMKDAVTKWIIGALIIVFATTIIGAIFGVIGINSSQNTGDAANNIVHALD